MALETIINNWKKEALPYLAATVSTLGCASGAISGNENQGGSAGSSQGEGGAGGFDSRRGSGGAAPECMPHAKLNCFQGNVYWNNSCDQLEDLYKQCTPTQKCENGACVDKYICPKNIDLV
ncbi:MAG: hypothetical protein AABX31_01565, partial [Nanoarchaeota archaeon]